MIFKLTRFFKRKKSPETKIERIYSKYRKDMYCEAIKILRDKAKTEDAVHQAMERIIKNQQKLDENDYYRTRMFVLVVCRNVAYSMLSDDEKEHFEYHDNYIGTYKTEPSEIIVSRENVATLLGCINSLKPIYRDVMMLKFYNGYENDEVAKMLGITEVTVRKRIERGRKMLKEMLEKEAEKDAKY